MLFKDLKSSEETEVFRTLMNDEPTSTVLEYLRKSSHVLDREELRVLFGDWYIREGERLGIAIYKEPDDNIEKRIDEIKGKYDLENEDEKVRLEAVIRAIRLPSESQTSKESFESRALEKYDALIATIDLAYVLVNSPLRSHLTNRAQNMLQCFKYSLFLEELCKFHSIDSSIVRKFEKSAVLEPSKSRVVLANSITSVFKDYNSGTCGLDRIFSKLRSLEPYVRY